MSPWRVFFCFCLAFVAGEVKELATALGSTNVEEMKDAVKKVIAAMTVNKDMSSLVPSVVNCMRTGEVAIAPIVV